MLSYATSFHCMSCHCMVCDVIAWYTLSLRDAACFCVLMNGQVLSALLFTKQILAT